MAFLRLRPFDYGIIILAAALAVFSAFMIYRAPGGGSRIVLKGPGGSWVYPQNQNIPETVSIAGPLGDTVVELRNGGARVLSSPCANQLCAASGTIHARGQWIACLPNQVLVTIEAAAPKGAEDELDAAAW
ncbi:MAG: NusG domain II-containing protein [Treponema sp.]|nr:NusG domain II-containing protein [Treponema sp.]